VSLLVVIANRTVYLYFFITTRFVLHHRMDREGGDAWYLF